jgi:hypothetical protein
VQEGGSDGAHAPLHGAAGVARTGNSKPEILRNKVLLLMAPPSALPENLVLAVA